MKLFVISDIHGYPAALKKAFAAFDASGADALLIAGDYMYHGHTLSEEQIASWCAEGSIVISGHAYKTLEY